MIRCRLHTTFPRKYYWPGYPSRCLSSCVSWMELKQWRAIVTLCSTFMPTKLPIYVNSICCLLAYIPLRLSHSYITIQTYFKYFNCTCLYYLRWHIIQLYSLRSVQKPIPGIHVKSSPFGLELMAFSFRFSYPEEQIETIHTIPFRILQTSLWSALGLLLAVQLI